MATQKKSTAKARPARENPQVPADVRTQAPKKKDKGKGKKVAIIIFAIFMSISMMVPSLSAIINGIQQQKQQDEHKLTAEQVDADMSKRIDELKAKVDKEPKEAQNWIDLGNGYLRWASFDQMFASEKKDQGTLTKLFSQAMAAFEKGRSLGGSPQAEIGMSSCLYQQGKVEEAINLLETYNKEKKEDARVLRSLGTLYEAEGERNKAISAYKRIIEIDPTNQMGQKKFAQGRLEAMAKEAAESAKRSEGKSVSDSAGSK